MMNILRGGIKLESYQDHIVYYFLSLHSKRPSSQNFKKYSFRYDMILKMETLSRDSQYLKVWYRSIFMEDHHKWKFPALQFQMVERLILSFKLTGWNYCLMVFHENSSMYIAIDSLLGRKHLNFDKCSLPDKYIIPIKDLRVEDNQRFYSWVC